MLYKSKFKTRLKKALIIALSAFVFAVAFCFAAAFLPLNKANDVPYELGLRSPAGSFTVAFSVNGGEAIADIVVSDSGATINSLPQAQKEGFKFCGWCLDENLENKVELPLLVREDLTLYAMYGYQIYFNNSASWAKTREAIIGKPFTLPAPSNSDAAEGMCLDGWYTSDGTESGVWDTKIEDTDAFLYSISANSKGDVLLFPKWIRKTFTYNFNKPDSSVEAKQVFYGDILTDLPVVAGNFDGWYSADGQGGDYGEKITEGATVGDLGVDGDVFDCYPRFYHTATFITNIDDLQNFTANIPDGDLLAKPNNMAYPERSFENWYTDAELTNPYNFDTVPEGDFTLYAKWLNVYRISFDTLGKGTAPSDIVSVPEGASGTITQGRVPQPNSGYIFKGWYADSLLTNEWNASSVVNKNITLYAKWYKTTAYSSIKNGVTIEIIDDTSGIPLNSIFSTEVIKESGIDYSLVVEGNEKISSIYSLRIYFEGALYDNYGDYTVKMYFPNERGLIKIAYYDTNERGLVTIPVDVDENGFAVFEVSTINEFAIITTYNPFGVIFTIFILIFIALLLLAVILYGIWKADYSLEIKKALFRYSKAKDKKDFLKNYKINHKLKKLDGIFNRVDHFFNKKGSCRSNEELFYKKDSKS